MTVTEQADAVLARARERVMRGDWVQWIWGCGTKECLHAMLQTEVHAETKSGLPTPLNGRVFYAVWAVLPEWAQSSIPRFNDSFTTTRDDVLAVIAAARHRLRTTEAKP